MHYWDNNVSCDANAHATPANTEEIKVIVITEATNWHNDYSGYCLYSSLSEIN